MQSSPPSPARSRAARSRATQRPSASPPPSFRTTSLAQQAGHVSVVGATEAQISLLTPTRLLPPASYGAPRRVADRPWSAGLSAESLQLSASARELFDRLKRTTRCVPLARAHPQRSTCGRSCFGARRPRDARVCVVTVRAALLLDPLARATRCARPCPTSTLALRATMAATRLPRSLTTVATSRTCVAPVWTRARPRSALG